MRSEVFFEKLEEAFGVNTPIFADEIVALFNNYTRAYVFRMLKNAETKGDIILFSRGVYYIPRKTFFGKSTICSEMVVEKKYVENNQMVYGVYAGLNLLNQFGITTQIPNKMEIVTNKETTRKRKVNINGREFILRSSRCEINKDNYPVYTILQLFSDMNEKDELSNFSRTKITDYLISNNITIANIFLMAKSFPSVTLRKIVGSGVLNGIVQR